MTDHQEANDAEAFGVFAGGPHGPPHNELPAVLDPEAMIWRSAEAAVAVASLLVYRSCVEMTILGRTRSLPLNETATIAAVRQGLDGRGDAGSLQFGVREGRLETCGARFTRHGFSYTAWCQLPPDDLVVFAEWANVGIERAEYSIAEERLRGAAKRTIILWPE